MKSPAVPNRNRRRHSPSAPLRLRDRRSRRPRGASRSRGDSPEFQLQRPQCTNDSAEARRSCTGCSSDFRARSGFASEPPPIPYLWPSPITGVAPDKAGFAGSAAGPTFTFPSFAPTRLTPDKVARSDAHGKRPAMSHATAPIVTPAKAGAPVSVPSWVRMSPDGRGRRKFLARVRRPQQVRLPRSNTRLHLLRLAPSKVCFAESWRYAPKNFPR